MVLFKCKVTALLSGGSLTLSILETLTQLRVEQIWERMGATLSGCLALKFPHQEILDALTYMGYPSSSIPTIIGSMSENSFFAYYRNITEQKLGSHVVE